MSKLNYSLERHLFHLLFQEDILDIPGFGRIEVQKFDAEIQEQSGLCLPAARRISFSPIARKSEVLINHLARYEGLSFDSAKDTIESITRNWGQELNQGKRLRLEGIGSFSKTGLQWVFRLQSRLIFCLKHLVCQSWNHVKRAAHSNHSS